jgi:hypothetical protein
MVQSVATYLLVLSKLALLSPTLESGEQGFTAIKAVTIVIHNKNNHPTIIQIIIIQPSSS